MSAFGQAGSALLPFVTGMNRTMAAQLGIQSLQPLYILYSTVTLVLNFTKIKLILFFFLVSLIQVVMMIVVGVVWGLVVPKGNKSAL